MAGVENGRIDYYLIDYLHTEWMKQWFLNAHEFVNLQDGKKSLKMGEGWNGQSNEEMNTWTIEEKSKE